MQNNNNILQRQNEILEENQRTIHHLITNQQNTSINNVSRIDETRNAELRKVFEEAADKIAR